MWKVERTCSFGFIGEDEFNSFDSAKIEFRHIIKNKHKDTIQDFTKLIDEYCDRYYKNNVPKEIITLKEMISNLVLDPNFPQNQEKELESFSFSDDNITIHFMFNELTFYVDNEEELTKFPQGEIKVIDISDEDEEYYFFITNNKDREINITLKNIDNLESDDDELDFIDDDFEDED